MEKTACEKIDMTNTQVVSLTTDGLGSTGFVFADGTNMLAATDITLDDGSTACVSLPLQLLQDSGVHESGTGIQNLILKNLNNALFLDASQIALLSGGSSHVVLSGDGLIDDVGEKIVIETETVETSTNINHNVSDKGLDITSVDLTPLDEGEVVLHEQSSETEASRTDCLNYNLAATISLPSPSKEQENNELSLPKLPRGDSAQPRREDIAIQSPLRKGPGTRGINGKGYTKSTHCKRHVKSTSKDKPFSCNICSASFCVEANLILHKATHEVDNPKCPECNKKFSRVASLKAHITLHQKEESLFCTECGDEFNTIQMDKAVCEKADLTNTQVVSLTSDAPGNTGFLFTDGTNVLASTDITLDDGSTAYVSLPLQLLQDSGVQESGTGIQNLILKNLNNALFLDASQVALLSGGSSHVVLSGDSLIDDGSGKILVETGTVEKSTNINQIVSNMGLDITSVDLTPLDEGEVVLHEQSSETEASRTDCLNYNLATTISMSSPNREQQNNEPKLPRRGPGRPRRDDNEIKPPIGKGPFKCEICGKEFTKSSQCKRHVKCHSDDKPFLCTICTASYNVEANLILHKATHEVGEPRCPECNKKFSRVASLKAHIMLHEKEENLFCSECGDEFGTIGQLNDHKKDHLYEWVKRPPPQCRQCKEQFSRMSQLREHMKEHYKVKASLSHKSHKRNIDRSSFFHKCDTCHKCFQKPSQLIRHRRIHTGEKPYKCQLCSRAFNQKGSLQIHMSKHNGLKPFSCDFCSATFSQKGNLRAHIVRVHTIPSSGEQVYKCMECTCVFKKLGSLNAHMSRMHSSESTKSALQENSDIAQIVNVRAVLSQLAELESDLRGRNPDQPSDSDILQQALVNSGLSGKEQTPSTTGLNDKQDARTQDQSSQENGTNDHKDSQSSYITLADRGIDGTVRRYIVRQRRVGNVKWHQCSYCTKEFKKPSDLVRHIRIHTHERPYKCTHCFRSFAVKSTLTAHIRTHTGVRDHVCYICLKKFSSASSLKVHIRVHTGTKPFACTVCDKTFRTTGHQKTHMLSHTKGGPVTAEEKAAKRKQGRQKPPIPNLPDVPLQEPIIITNNGYVQAVARNSTVFLPGNTVSLDRPYKCTICNAAFRKSSHLKQHIRMHTGERPYKCNRCDRRFISNGVLKAHMRTHEGVKAYKCSECNNLFSTNGSLKRHMGTHSDLRPFMCPYCHKTFKTSVNCRKHMKTHKTEIALQMVQRAAKEGEKGDPLSNLQVDGQVCNIISESGAFPPEGLGPDFTQAFSDQPFQVHTTTEQQDQEESAFAQSNLVHTLETNELGETGNPETTSGVITHTLHADASGTITLPNLAGQQALTQENIREIERTLNEQIFGASTNVTTDLVEGTSNSLASRVRGGEESEPESTTTEDLARTLGATSSQATHPDPTSLSNLSGDPKESSNQDKTPADPSNATNMFGTTFDSGFEACVFSAITLQSDPLELEGLESGTTLTTTMASILPPSGTSVNKPESEVNTTTDEQGTEVSAPMDGPIAAAAVEADTGDKDKNYVPGRPFNADAPPGERPYKCKQCSRAFKKLYHLKEHARSHMGKTLSCILCERKCTSYTALRAHLKTHDGSRNFRCDICGCHFTTNGSLKRHMAVHSDERHIKLHEPRERKGKLVASNPLQPRGRRRAEVIRLTAEETQVLAQQPLDNATSVSEKVLIASAAEKDRISELKDPEQQYNMEPIHPNQCKYCPKSFRKPSDLVRHIRIHTGERPYQCGSCNKCFTVKSTLDSHLKTHGGQKLFACHVCGCLFSTKGSLKVHMRLHTGARPFKCPLCDMRFRTSGHRKAHLMSHMKHAANENNSQLHQDKQTVDQPSQDENQIQVTELSNNTPSNAQLISDSTAQLTLDPGTLNLEAFNPASLLTSDGSQVTGNFQLQLSDGSLQIAGMDPSSVLQLASTQSLQLDETLLQQLQASNIIIQTSSDGTIGDTQGLENQEEQQSADAGTELAVRYEIHTDENGQIINIQPATLPDDVASRNAEDGTFDLTGGLDMEVEEHDTQSSRFRVSDGRKNGRTLLLMNAQKERDSGANSVESFIVYHECETCGKQFSKRSQLERHTRIHTGERPFKCLVCEKSFNQKNALNTHMKSHTGERPYNCQFCNYSFTQKGNLKTHIRRAHQFSSIESPAGSSPATTSVSPSTNRSLLKPKQDQPTFITLSTSDLSVGKTLDLERVVGDLFPQMKNTVPADP